MKIAFVRYQGVSSLEFGGVFDPLTRLAGLDWETAEFESSPGLGGYDLVIFPGGADLSALLDNPGFMAWVKTAGQSAALAAVGSAALLLASAGLIQGSRAAAQADSNLQAGLEAQGVKLIPQRVVEDGRLITSAGGLGGIELGLALCQRIAGPAAAEEIRRQINYPPSPAANLQPGSPPQLAPRRAQVSRRTAETAIEIDLGLDGSGAHQVSTGIPFLDHMLVQVAVHGLFDLQVRASGDLHIDSHHTAEDTALALGQAFREALGSKAGIYRTASVEVPMDESLARVTLDFSGRPYTVFDAAWHTPQLGTLPVSLVAHFFESFAIQAGCNLHARVFYGRDDHHQAEALFKAFGRALDSATRIDPRRAGNIPSSKGIL